MKEGIIMKKKNKSVRDTWIPATWRYNGAGYQKNKKAYNRKTKHKANAIIY